MFDRILMAYHDRMWRYYCGRSVEAIMYQNHGLLKRCGERMDHHLNKLAEIGKKVRA